jgi:hypothetical protein
MKKLVEVGKVMITDAKWNGYFVAYVHVDEDDGEIYAHFGRTKEGFYADELTEEEYEVFGVIEDILERLDMEWAVEYTYVNNGKLTYEQIVNELSKCPFLIVKMRDYTHLDGMTFTEDGAICNECHSNYRITRSSNGQLLFECGRKILHLSHLIPEEEYFKERKNRGFGIHPIY